MNSNRVFLSFVVAALLIAAPDADAVFPTVALKAVCLQQIHSPTTITFAPGGSGRLFVCDQPGKIYIIQDGMLLPTPFLNIASPSNVLVSDRGPGPAVTQTTGYSERGLLGLAFHPGYSNPLSPGYRKFYVNYNKDYQPGIDPPPPVADHTPNCATVIAEFTVSATDPNLAVLASERRLLVFTQPQSNHNGGQLEFGPDGFLYVGCGDGGSSNDNNVGHTGGSGSRPTTNLGNGQDKTTYLGKILRIDPIDPDGGGPLTYAIPSSNPFFNDVTPGLKKEIYAYGLRNPWRFSFDQRAGGTNRLFCGDVGQGRIEEIDLIVSGGNYGWRYKEGVEFPSFSVGSPVPAGTVIDPIAMYAHVGVVTNPVLPQLGLSVTGGFVYRGAAIPALQGKYVFGDYGSTSGASDGRMMGLEETAPGSGVFTLNQAIPFLGTANPIVGQRILGLGEDESGEIYIGMKTNSGVLLLDGGRPAGGIFKIVPVLSNTAMLPPAKDNTIFSEPNSPPFMGISGYASDAQGYLYAGRTGTAHGPFLRRALIRFDVAEQVPTGAVIQSAQLQLRITRLGPSAFGQTLALHRLSETWGEGFSMNAGGQGFGATATTDDATWVRRFFNTSSWTTAGGTFATTASATTPVSSVFVAFNSTTQLKADVQGWLNTPASNAGWILRGDEVVDEAVCQFSSLQQGISPPALSLSFDYAQPLTHREAWQRAYFLVGQFVDDFADLDGDGIVSLIEYAYGFSPLTANSQTAGLQASSEVMGTDTVFTFTFRRDPEASDLTYTLQSSGDLESWTDIVTSVAGADPTGSGYVGENDIIGELPKRLVTAQETLPTETNPNRYVRLRVSRAP